MSYALSNIAGEIPLPPARRAVLLVLADMANHAGVCWPSIATIARRACVSVRSVFTHLAALVKAGLIHRRQRIGRSNVFTLALHAPTDGPDSAPDQATSAPAPELTPTPQPAQQSAPAPVIAPTALTVETVVQAMRRAGLMGSYECGSLAALVASASPTDGLTEFTEAATEATKRGKGFAWALARVAGKRKDASRADTTRCTVPGMVGRDPVLIQLEQDAAKSTPPPASIRERLAQLRAAIVGN